MTPLNIFNTYIDNVAFHKVNEALNSTFLSEGKLVKEFEDKLSNEFGLKNPVAVNSGTSALHLALIVAGVQQGDEVICPAQTFVASALVILQQGAVPVFADICYESGNINSKDIESSITKRTKAIMVVHWGGYPCDMEEIILIAKKNNLIVIEDAAHAFGATYKNKPIGAMSDITCFSFQAIKQVTTGDGGAICCVDQIMSASARKKRWFGIDRKNSPASLLGERQYNLTEIGYKYHLNDYAAALGLANLENYKARLNRRIKFAESYRKNFIHLDGITLFENKSDRQNAYWLFGMHVKKRDAFVKAMKSRGVIASVVHQRIDRNKIFGGIKNDLVNQTKFDSTQIHIPIHDGLNEEKIEYIIDAIKKGW